MSGALSIMVKEFNNTGKLPSSLSIEKKPKRYNSEGVEYVSDEEQEEFENDKKFMKDLAIAEQEIRDGKGIVISE